MKLKPLLSTLRERKRYMVYNIIVKDGSGINHVDAVSAMTNSFGNIYGSFNLGKAGIISLPEYYDGETNTGILRINHQYVDKVKASNCFIKNIHNNDVIVRSIITTGVLRKAREKIKKGE